MNQVDAAPGPAVRWVRPVVFWLGPLMAAAVGLGCAHYGLAPPACWCAATATLCAIWWIFEPIPMAATGLIPFVAFPLTGVMDHQGVAHAYGHYMILLLLGGAFLSVAMENSGAHRRIALSLIALVGGDSGRRVVLGFMVATASLSMWISNTASTLMILPIAMAVLAQCSDVQLRRPLYLGIAYAASVGGMATPIGTPPNVLFISAYYNATGDMFSFVDWMQVGLPIVFCLIPVIWLVLTRGLRLSEPIVMPRIGRWQPAERRVLVIFGITSLLWVFRSSPFGGWAAAIGAIDPETGTPLVGDATVALLAAVALFVVPSGRGDGAGLLDWQSTQRVPWGVLLMFAGGLALAAGFTASGLGEVIGQGLAGLGTLPVIAVIALICLLVTFMTEITSSTATTALLLPILASTAEVAQIDPIVLMMPATISASCAFMLPVATAPNAIVFSSGELSVRQMARTGVALNFIAAAIITLITYFLIAGGTS